MFYLLAGKYSFSKASTVKRVLNANVTLRKGSVHYYVTVLRCFDRKRQFSISTQTKNLVDSHGNFRNALVSIEKGGPYYYFTVSVSVLLPEPFLEMGRVDNLDSPSSLVAAE